MSTRRWNMLSIVLLACLGVADCFSAAGAADPIVVKMATMGNPGDSPTKYFEYFGAELSKRSNGAFKCELFHSGQLGAQRDYIDGLQMGSIQMAEMASSVVATIDTAFALFDMPYLSPSQMDQWATLKSGPDKILRKSLLEKANLYVVGWLVRSPRNVYSSKAPITSAADFKGLKIRTMESPPMLRAMELLGAKPTPIPANERYLALQTKVVDAAENDSGEIFSKKEYEVTKYLSKTSWIIQPNVVCVNNDFLSAMPSNLRELFLEVAAEASEVATRYDHEIVEKIEEQLVKNGMIINEIPDKSDFVRILQPLYTEYTDKIGKELMDFYLKK